MHEVARLTGGTAHLGPGTLYRTIAKLVDDGVIEAVAPAASDADERRVAYRLTRLGHEVAKSESARLAHLVGIARQRGLLDRARTGKGARP